MRGPVKFHRSACFQESISVSEDRVEVNYEVCAWLVHYRKAVHITSSVTHWHWRQAPLHFIRERLDSSVPSRWKLSSPIIFLRKSGRELAVMVVAADDSQMLIAEAFVAMAAMPVPISVVVISPMFPAVIVIVVPSLDGLRRQNHPSGCGQEHQ